jgi:hypothetical protein
LAFHFLSRPAGKIPVPRAIPGRRGRLVHRVRRAYKASPASKVRPVLKDHRVYREPQVTKAIRVTRATAHHPISGRSKLRDQ